MTVLGNFFLFQVIDYRYDDSKALLEPCANLTDAGIPVRIRVCTLYRWFIDTAIGRNGVLLGRSTSCHSVLIVFSHLS